MIEWFNGLDPFIQACFSAGAVTTGIVIVFITVDTYKYLHRKKMRTKIKYMELEKQCGRMS